MFVWTNKFARAAVSVSQTVLKKFWKYPTVAMPRAPMLLSKLIPRNVLNVEPVRIPVQISPSGFVLGKFKVFITFKMTTNDFKRSI